MAINNNIPSTQLNLATNLETVACTAHYKGIQLNICNLYLPEHEIITCDKIDNLLKSIPDPKIVLGDMNAKHVSWGSPINNNRGILLLDQFHNNGLFILNDGSPTRSATVGVGI